MFFQREFEKGCAFYRMSVVVCLLCHCRNIQHNTIIIQHNLQTNAPTVHLPPPAKCAELRLIAIFRRYRFARKRVFEPLITAETTRGEPFSEILFHMVHYMIIRYMCIRLKQARKTVWIYVYAFVLCMVGILVLYAHLVHNVH